MAVPSSLSPELGPIRGKEEVINLSESDSILRIADKKFMNGQLQEAMTELLKNRQDIKSEKVTFQLGLLELIQDHPKDAINYFDQSDYDRDEVAWFKALAYLKLNNTSICLEELNKIGSTSRWSAKSKILASKLR